MLFGIHYAPTAESMNVADVARAAEERGFDSLFIPEHTHIPVTLRTPRRSGPVPISHATTLDPWIALTAAAASTSRLLLGTGVCLITERDPIVLAREVSSLDVLSGGRVILGVGVGSVVDEMVNHGVDPDHRWQVMRERVLAMKAIWTHDQAEFHGSYVNFDPIYQWPKPVQKPHPPIYMGGSGPHVLNRVLAYGDAWMPTVTTAGTNFLERVAELQHLAQEKGRGLIPVSTSDPDPDPALLEGFQKAGIERSILRVPDAGPDVVLPLLDRFAALAETFA